MARDKTVTGAIGAVPPPDAPVEQAQPLTDAYYAERAAKARQNERTLAPLVAQGPKPPIPTPTSAQVPNPSISALVADVFGTEDVPAIPHPSVETGSTQADVDQIDDFSAEDLKRMPAASNSESPARGILPNLVPETTGKKAIEGGWGDGGSDQYNPLNGEELRQIGEMLIEQVRAQMANDLRFSMALTYPKARIRASIEIECDLEDAATSVMIEKVHVPKGGEKGGTPMEIARQRADGVCFVVHALRQEFTPAGDVDGTPDGMRDELGVAKPRMTRLDASGYHQTVDIVSPGADVAALMRG